MRDVDAFLDEIAGYFSWRIPDRCRDKHERAGLWQ
jgi:hypothetical protein